MNRIETAFLFCLLKLRFKFNNNAFFFWKICFCQKKNHQQKDKWRCCCCCWCRCWTLEKEVGLRKELEQSHNNVYDNNKKQQSFFISGYSKERNYSSPSFPFVAPEFIFWWFTIAASRILMQNWKKSIWIQSIVSFANTSPYVYDFLRLVMSYLPCDVLSDATRYLP